MLLIVCATVAPVIVVVLAGLAMAVFGDARRAPARGLRARETWRAIAAESRWEGLTEEIARRGDQRRRRHTDAAVRGRHLAAVLPADARR